MVNDGKDYTDQEIIRGQLSVHLFSLARITNGEMFQDAQTVTKLL